MPSKIIFEKKQAEVEALAEKIQNSVSGVLAGTFLASFGSVLDILTSAGAS